MRDMDGEEPAGAGVARVAVEVPLANLDRPFDYRVTEAQAEAAVVGARVRVRFAGKLRGGFIVERPATSERDDLLPLQAVVSPEPVLTPAIAELVRRVADHYAGSFVDVVRLAVPPRHGITERATPPDHPAPDLTGEPAGSLEHYPGGAGYLAALADGRAPRAAWTAAPRPDGAGDWIGGFLDAAAATLAAGRGALLLVPDATDLAALSEQARLRFGAGSFVSLAADAGPAARYRAFLAALRGRVRLVLGNRSAVFAPVADLGLVALWDDGDDSWADQHAPYPHAREVAALRAHTEASGLLLAARGRTAEVQALVEAGWLRPVALPPAETRAVSAMVRVTAATDLALERDSRARSARVPHEVFEVIRAGLAAGPVLVQVPRAGYRPLLNCAVCGTPAACPRCRQLLLELAERPGPACRWCGPPVGGWHCAECRSRRVRAPVVGVQRTTEEFGRAFPGTRVLSSSADARVTAVDDRPAIVLATPGAEPPARFGYAAAVLLDGAALLRRADLRAGEEAPRCCWIRPRCCGGQNCARPRRRCGAGWPSPRSSARARRAGPSCWSPTRPNARRRLSCGSTRSGSPNAN
jgi:primosomal protein N' (replication factor Y)